MQNHHAILVRQPEPQSYRFDSCESEVIRFNLDKLGVAEVGQIKQKAYLAPEKKSTKTILICASSITVEAQNALLKIFEEPPAATNFILVVDPFESILKTLLSRLSIEKIDTEDVTNITWKKFVESSYADRLSMVEVWNKKKDSKWFESIKSGFYKWLESSNPDKNLLLVSNHLGRRGASNKMLLEFLAMLDY